MLTAKTSGCTDISVLLRDMEFKCQIQTNSALSDFKVCSFYHYTHEVPITECEGHCAPPGDGNK